LAANTNNGRDMEIDSYTPLAEEIVELIRDEWDKQGHDMTGAFKQSITFEITEEQYGTRIRFIDGTDRGYGRILNIGVRPQDIKYPFAPARIRGLTNFAMLRMGLDEKEARSVAYAIATKHAREGMPLTSSKQYSQTGQRTEFVQAIMNKARNAAKRRVIQFIKGKAAERKPI